MKISVWMPESGWRAQAPVVESRWLRVDSMDFWLSAINSRPSTCKAQAIRSRVSGWNTWNKAARSAASGGQSVVEPPGPIPNPEVKRRSADGSGTTGPVRVGRRQVFARHPQQ